MSDLGSFVNTSRFGDLGDAFYVTAWWGHKHMREIAVDGVEWGYINDRQLHEACEISKGVTSASHK